MNDLKRFSVLILLLNMTSVKSIKKQNESELSIHSISEAKPLLCNYLNPCLKFLLTINARTENTQKTIRSCEQELNLHDSTWIEAVQVAGLKFIKLLNGSFCNQSSIALNYDDQIQHFTMEQSENNSINASLKILAKIIKTNFLKYKKNFKCFFKLCANGSVHSPQFKSTDSRIQNPCYSETFEYR